MGGKLRRALIVTGAGISAESGIPTFRGPSGYWRNLDPTRLATAEAFDEDPATVWEWYRERRRGIRAAEPNAAHRAVVQLVAHARDSLLLTQNVDDLHARAEWDGRRLPAEQVVKIHGDIFTTRCRRCDFSRTDAADTDHATDVPACPQCGARLRPGVVWFNEHLDPDNIDRVQRFLASGPSDLVIVVGTTAAFGYIIEWTRLAAGAGGRLIEVNPEPTPLSAYATEVVRQPAAVALPAIVAGAVAG